MPDQIPLDTIERAVDDIRSGRPVVVVDDEGRENEGDLIFAAELATPELMGFTVRWSSGVVCAPMLGADLDRLGIPLMVAQNRDAMRTAYTVSVDAATGVTTGISAADRALTVRTLAATDTHGPTALTQPGHVFPLRARDLGVLERPGHTEAAVDLTRLAGLRPAGVIAELVHDDGTMMRAPALREFADTHDLAMIAIDDLVRHRRATEQHVSLVTSARLPAAEGEFTAHAFRDDVDGTEHLVLTMGDVEGAGDLLVRLHSECLTGDVLGSRRCDCGDQLHHALAQVAAEGRGAVVYVRGHEGRGIGLAAKIGAYALQDAGRDTVDANLELGFPADARDYASGVQILRALGVTGVRLLSNNPDKVAAIEAYGLPVVERLDVHLPPTTDNLDYLRTKRDRMGHHLSHLDLPTHPPTEGAPV